MKHCFYWKYSLRSVQPLNAQSSRTEHEGALIRLKNGGVGCIHPWPELGDLPLSEQLRILVNGGRTPLTDAAVECAEMDGVARTNGLSLFASPIPESHFLAMDGDDPEFVKSQGFRTVKLKGGPDLSALSKKIQKWGESGFQLRIDMNESVELDGFLSFWKSLDEQSISAIELVEDPVVWSEFAWGKLRKEEVQIAVDRDAENRLRKGDIRVFKPACQENRSPQQYRYFVTSYMDHAIGQMWAAFYSTGTNAAYEGDHVLTCGLMTHRCFEPDDFFERIETKGPILQAPEGTGLGFDDLLEKLPWKKLT